MKRYLFAYVLLLTLLCSCQDTSKSQSNQDNDLDAITYPEAEYDRGKVVLMHQPEEELSLGTFHPDAALFKQYLNPDSAKVEHQGYQEILRKLGIEVHTVREMLLKDCVDDKGQWIEGEQTVALRQLAARSLTFTPEGDMTQAEADEYKQKYLQQYSPNDIIRILLQRPEIILKKVNINTGIEADYRLNPLMNMFFMRDQSITTGKGPVICKMNSSQRESECDIVEFCLKKIGKAPIHRIQGEEAFMEGGDYIPTRDFDMIGCGLRTTQQAINQLMDYDLLGKDTLVVVKDAWKSQIQMHLDTYFNVIDHDLVTLCSNRYFAKEGDKDFLTVDIYARQGEGTPYSLVKTNESFLEFLKQRNMEIIPIMPEDEEHFGNNFICIEGREIVMVAGQSQALKDQLKAKGVKVHWAPVTNLTYGYGAAHCMTQMIGRSRVK